MNDHAHNHHPPARLLIVDDDAVLRMTLGKLYTRAGYAVVLANDGEEALNYARDQAFDLVLIDLNRPVLNGIETLKALKRIAPEMPVVIFTASEDELAGEEAIAHNVDRFLIKPLRRHDLLSLAQEIVHKKINQDGAPDGFEP